MSRSEDREAQTASKVLAGVANAVSELDPLARLKADRIATNERRLKWREAGRRCALDRLSWPDLERLADWHLRRSRPLAHPGQIAYVAGVPSLESARPDEVSAFLAGVCEVREKVQSTSRSE